MGHEQTRPLRDGWLAVELPAALIIGLALLLTIEPGTAEPAPSEAGIAVESYLRLLVGYLGALAELAAALVIGAAVLRGVVAALGILTTAPDTRTLLNLLLEREIQAGEARRRQEP